MRKSIVILVLGISSLVLAGLVVNQHRQIQQLRAASATTMPAVESKAGNTTGDAEAPVQKDQGHRTTPLLARTSSDGEALPPNAPTPTASNAIPEAGETEDVSAAKSPMTEIAKMMKNPGMKDMVRAQQKGQMDLMYGSLYKYLQLPEAELETFKALLLDKQMAIVDSAMDMMGGATTPEEREAAVANIKAITADYDAQIKAFLNEEDFAVFQSYEATQPERMQVNMFKGGLSSSDAMTEEQEDKLIRAMHEERTNFHFSVDGFGNNQVEDPSRITPDVIESLMKDTAKLQDQYIAKAASILTPAQLEQFKENQKQQLAMQKMGMEMASSMFGKPSKE